MTAPGHSLCSLNPGKPSQETSAGASRFAPVSSLLTELRWTQPRQPHRCALQIRNGRSRLRATQSTLKPHPQLLTFLPNSPFHATESFCAADPSSAALAHLRFPNGKPASACCWLPIAKLTRAAPTSIPSRSLSRQPLASNWRRSISTKPTPSSLLPKIFATRKAMGGWPPCPSRVNSWRSPSRAMPNPMPKCRRAARFNSQWTPHL